MCKQCISVKQQSYKASIFLIKIININCCEDLPSQYCASRPLFPSKKKTVIPNSVSHAFSVKLGNSVFVRL